MYFLKFDNISYIYISVICFQVILDNYYKIHYLIEVKDMHIWNEMRCTIENCLNNNHKFVEYKNVYENVNTFLK